MTYHDHQATTLSETSKRTYNTPRVWLNRHEAAEYLGVHINTLDRYVKRGHIPAHRIGAAVRIHRIELDAAMFGGGYR